MYKPEETTGKKRNVGAEAPSARVFKTNTQEFIIGMMAQNVQLLVSHFSLHNKSSKQIINDFEAHFKENTKLNLIVVVNNSFEEIEDFKQKNTIEKTIITQDKNGDFAKRFGVGLYGDYYKENLANGVFLIDKEAQLKYVNYFFDIENSQLEEIFKTTQETIDFKPKGHAHENWMGA